MELELMDCTRVLMDVIEAPQSKRKDVAAAYWMALRSTEETDWSKVNLAIIARWSFAALEWIKREAHKQ